MLEFYDRIKYNICLEGMFMKKILFCNLDLLRPSINGFNNPNLINIRNEFLHYVRDLCFDKSNHVYFISRDQNTLNSAKKYFVDELGLTDLKFRLRDEARSFVLANKDRNNLFVFVGGKEVDFHMAVHTRSLFIVPTWIPFEDKAIHYGVSVDTPSQLFKFIRTLNNHENWYAEVEIEPNVFVLSLMDGRHKFKARTNNEREMLAHFESLLKTGESRDYYHILLYHFLAGMTNSKLFDDIELFGMIPSSDCTLNQDIFSFMWQTRIIKGKQNPRNLINGENIVLRTIPKMKAHLSYGTDQRANMGAAEEFKTICINPDFKNKINTLKKGNKFNACIFDDYITHGNSFNAVRNLLKSLGANKIIFISLGNFGRPFQKKDYNIIGDVYQNGYTYSLINSSERYFSYNNAAKDEVAVLYDIFNS